MKFKKSLLASGATLAAAIIWGGYFAVLKYALGDLGPNTITSIRFLIAAVFMCIVFRKKLKLINKVSIRRGAILGVFLYAGYIFQTISLQYTTAGKAAFLVTIYVVIVPFIYWATAKIRPRLYNIAAMLICMTGVGLLSLTSALTLSFGDSFSLLAGVMFAFHLVINAIFLKKEDLYVITTLQIAFVSLYSGVIAFAFETLPPNPFELNIVLPMLYNGFLSTFLALLLQFWGQQYISPSRTSLIVSTESVFGALAGVLFLAETMTARMVIGCALIFFAVILSETKLNSLFGKPDL